MNTNACAKYVGWMTDAALGALAQGREAELLAHAAECEDCRAAYQHARGLATLVDRGVESLVAGEPSPHFSTRLRARIAEEPAPSRAAWLAWKPIAAGLTVAVIAAIVLVSYRPRRHNLQPTPARAGAQAEAVRNPSPTMAGGQVTEAELNAKPATKELQVRRSYSARQGRALAAQAISRQHHVPHRVTSSPQPEVIVPPGQFEAVMQFADAIQSGRIDGKQLLAAEQETDKPLKIKPLEIAPLVEPSSDISPKQPADSGRP